MGDLTISEGWALLLASVSAFLLLANAFSVLVKAWKTFKAPNENQNERIGKCEERLGKVEDKLENDHKRIAANDEGNRLLQKAMLALLDHGIDGNNIAQMQHAKEDLQNYLIDR